MDRCGLGPDGMADRAEACYGGGISQVNESWGAGGVPKGIVGEKIVECLFTRILSANAATLILIETAHHQCNETRLASVWHIALCG